MSILALVSAAQNILAMAEKGKAWLRAASHLEIEIMNNDNNFHLHLLCIPFQIPYKPSMYIFIWLPSAMYLGLFVEVLSKFVE